MARPTSTSGPTPGPRAGHGRRGWRGHRFGVGEALASERHRGVLACARLRLEELVGAVLAVIRRRGVVPPGQDSCTRSAAGMTGEVPSAGRIGGSRRHRRRSARGAAAGVVSNRAPVVVDHIVARRRRRHQHGAGDRRQHGRRRRPSIGIARSAARGSQAAGHRRLRRAQQPRAVICSACSASATACAEVVAAATNRTGIRAASSPVSTASGEGLQPARRPCRCRRAGDRAPVRRGEHLCLLPSLPATAERRGQQRRRSRVPRRGNVSSGNCGGSASRRNGRAKGSRPRSPQSSGAASASSSSGR